MSPPHRQLAGSFLIDSINILFCNLYGAIQPRFPPALCHPLLHLILNLILQRERERVREGERSAVCSAKSKGFCNPHLGTAPTQRLNASWGLHPPPLSPLQGSPIPQNTIAGLISPPPLCYFPQGQHSVQWKGSAQPLRVHLRGC